MGILSFFSSLFSRNASPHIEGDEASGRAWRQAPDADLGEVLAQANENDKLRSVVELVAGRLALVEWKLIRNKKVVDADFDPMLVAWKRPNQYMGSLAFLTVLFKYLLLADECFLRVTLDERGNLQLYPLPNTWVTVLSDEQSEQLFEVHYPTSGTFQMYTSEEVLWIKKPSIEDTYGRARGRGFAASADAQTETYAGNFIRSFFFNDAMTGSIVSAPGMGPEAAKKLKKTFEEDATGKAWKTRVVTPPPGSKVEVHRFMPALNDLTIPEIEKRCGANIRRLFFVSPELFGELESSNRATIREALAILSAIVLNPEMKFLQSELNARLVPMVEKLSSRYRGYSFQYVDPTPPDHSSRDKFILANPRNYSLNEYRQASGMPPVEGGDLINAEDGEPIGRVIEETKQYTTTRKAGEVVTLRIPKRMAS